MNPIAENLNQTIVSQNKAVFSLFSSLGKNLFFPKGIMSQSQEAKEKAFLYNATIGIATDKEGPLAFKSILKYFSNLDKKNLFPYAPSYGLKLLRQAWKKRLNEVCPFLKEQSFSLPIVTSGLTHGLSIVGDLFMEEGDRLILPNQIWGNYNLIFGIRRQVKLDFFNFFEKNNFNLTAFEAAIDKQATVKKEIKILLNFPNNPTGYMISKESALGIKEVLHQKASEGLSILILLDDAYFSIYYEKESYEDSLFSELCNLHENLLAVKIDGISKEFFAWGFRIGFLTYGVKSAKEDLYQAIESKTGGAIRGNLSNVSLPSQSLILDLLNNNAYQNDFKKNYEELKQRYLEVKRVLKTNDYQDAFLPYPFNAGYFMLVQLNAGLDAETLRKKLLEKGIGVIAIGSRDIRIAFSCLEKEVIESFFNSIYKVCKSLLKE